LQKPVLLRFEEVEGSVDELGGLAVGAAGEFALDALLGGGIESERHGESIRAGCVGESGSLRECPLVR